MNTADIRHRGIVKDIDSQYIYVMIISKSACASCHAQSACSIFDMKEKIIKIPVGNEHYGVGEEVNVAIRESLGHLAVILSYVLPLFLFMGVIITLSMITNNELLTGASGIMMLIAYYVVLYFFRANLKKKFSFSIMKSYGAENISCSV